MDFSSEISLLYELIALEKQELDRLYKQKSDYIEERHELFDKLDDIKSKISDICSDIDRVKSDLSSLYSQKEDYVYSLRHKRDEIDSAYSNHEDYSSIYWLKSDRDTIVDHITYIQGKIDDLKSEKSDLIDDLTDAKDEREKIGSDLMDIKEKIGEVVSLINAHKEKKRILCEKLTELKQKSCPSD